MQPLAKQKIQELNRCPPKMEIKEKGGSVSPLRNAEKKKK
jgi:hypothetical protein